MTEKNMIVQEIRRELQENADEQYRQSIQRFFKEEIKLFGVKTPLFKKITQNYFSFSLLSFFIPTFIIFEQSIPTIKGYGLYHLLLLNAVLF